MREDSRQGLSGRQGRSGRRRPNGRFGPVLLGILIALAVITVWEAASEHAQYDFVTNAEPGSDGKHRIRIRDGRWRLAIDLRGEIELTPDERGIARLGPGALLEIEERNRGQRRRLEASPGPGGEPMIAWFVGRRRTELDAAGREWLAGMLPRVYRATGLDAEGRVSRLLASGGVAGVLSEIAQIRGDGVQRLYFEQLLAQAEPTGDDLEKVLRRMAREVASDHEMGRLLARLPTGELSVDAVASAFAAAASTVGSDYELRRALSAHLEPGVDAGVCETLVAACGSIGGDFELAELLVEVAAECPADRPLPDGYARALRSIGTDFEHRRALAAALARPGVSDEELDRLLATADTIGSDFDQAELLIEVARNHPGRLPETWFRAAATIGTDYEQRRTLAAVVAREGLDAETVVRVLETSAGVGSDHELTQLLLALAEARPLDAELRPAFERAASRIGSEYERRRVLAAGG